MPPRCRSILHESRAAAPVYLVLLRGAAGAASLPISSPGFLMMSAPEGSFGSAARAAASSGLRASAGAGCGGGRDDSLLPALVDGGVDSTGAAGRAGDAAGAAGSGGGQPPIFASMSAAALKRGSHLVFIRTPRCAFDAMAAAIL